MNNLLILLDLDDTLLTNKMDTFLPAYLKSLGKKLAPIVSPDKMVSTLLTATRKMVAKSYPESTLEKVFDDAFYGALEINKESMQPLIQQYYNEEFPKLKPLTQPRQEAIDLVQEIFRTGYQAAVATNPLFPKLATYQRLAWAELNHQQYPFSVVTTYENFHFCKPNPAYYAEILAQLGWQHSTAVMIGNDWQDDILPAAELGLPVFWVTDETRTLPGSFHPSSSQGPLKDVISWITRIAEIPESETQPQSISAMLAILKSTPAALDSLTKIISPALWQQKQKENQFSLAENAYHLYEVDEDVNLLRIEKILNEENPFIPAADSDSWIMKRNREDFNGPLAVTKFIQKRTQMIQVLENLTLEQWERKARHAIFGPITLKELVGFIGTHDKVHIRDLYETIKLS